MNHRKRGDDISHESMEAVVDTVFGVATEPVAKILDAELSAGIRDRIRAVAVAEFNRDLDDMKWIQKVFARCRGATSRRRQPASTSRPAAGDGPPGSGP